MTKEPNDFSKWEHAPLYYIKSYFRGIHAFIQHLWTPIMPALVTYRYIWLGPDTQITYRLHRQTLFLFLTPSLYKEYLPIPLARSPNKNMTSEKVEYISQPC